MQFWKASSVGDVLLNLSASGKSKKHCVGLIS